MANFWKYSGSEERTYPAYQLDAVPGYVYDFGAGSQPGDGRWVSDPGPATAPPPPVQPGVVAGGPQQGQVLAWDAVSASYKATDLSGSFQAVGRPYKPGAFTALMNTLAEGTESCALQVLGDSTGYTSGKTRWTDILAPWLAQKFPGYGVQTTTWNDTNQSYDPPVQVQAQPNGASNLVFNGTGSAIHPGYAAPPTGDIDVRVKVMADWTTNTVKTLVGYWGGGQSSTRAFNFTAKQTSLVFQWSSDGVAQAFSQQSTASPSYPASNVPVWLRATLQTAVPMSAPAITLGATATSGGSFTAGAYFWKVTAIAGTGETLGSNEVTATLAANGTQVLNWTGVTGASGYKVYRGTAAGAENTLVATLGAVTTYTDTGAAGSGASLPSSNTGAYWSLKFYQSSDGATWTQVGSTWNNNTGATSINAANAWQYEIGASAGSASPLTGTVYAAQVLNGIGGPTTVPASPDLWSAYTGATVTRGGSPMLTLVNGSKPGADITYLSDSTRLPKMLPFDYGTAAIVLSCSHNDGTKRGTNYLSSWDSWLTSIRNRYPYTGLAVTAQNPRTSPASNIQTHQARRRDITQWAAKNGLTLIDVYRAFIESSTGLTSLVDQTDGIHPSDASGSPLWAQTVESALLGRS